MLEHEESDEDDYEGYCEYKVITTKGIYMLN